MSEERKADDDWMSAEEVAYEMDNVMEELLAAVMELRRGKLGRGGVHQDRVVLTRGDDNDLEVVVEPAPGCPMCLDRDAPEPGDRCGFDALGQPVPDNNRCAMLMSLWGKALNSVGGAAQELGGGNLMLPLMVAYLRAAVVLMRKDNTITVSLFRDDGRAYPFNLKETEELMDWFRDREAPREES